MISREELYRHVDLTLALLPFCLRDSYRFKHVFTFVYFSYNGQSVEKFPYSIREHQATSLGIYDGRPMAIGGVGYFNRFVETVFDDGKWSEIGRVNVGRIRELHGYSTVTIDEYLYVFGNYTIINHCYYFGSKVKCYQRKNSFFFKIYQNNEWNFGFQLRALNLLFNWDLEKIVSSDYSLVIALHCNCNVNFIWL